MYENLLVLTFLSLLHVRRPEAASGADAEAARGVFASTSVSENT